MEERVVIRRGPKIAPKRVVIDDERFVKEAETFVGVVEEKEVTVEDKSKKEYQQEYQREYRKLKREKQSK